jgi:hypothetical protein
MTADPLGAALAAAEADYAQAVADAGLPPWASPLWHDAVQAADEVRQAAVRAAWAAYAPTYVCDFCSARRAREAAERAMLDGVGHDST